MAHRPLCSSLHLPLPQHSLPPHSCLIHLGPRWRLYHILINSVHSHVRRIFSPSLKITSLMCGTGGIIIFGYKYIPVIEYTDIVSLGYQRRYRNPLLPPEIQFANHINFNYLLGRPILEKSVPNSPVSPFSRGIYILLTAIWSVDLSGWGISWGELQGEVVAGEVIG